MGDRGGEGVPSSDEVLLAALAAGDHHGATAFVHRFQGPVHAIALAVLGQPAEAEEVAQQALVQAWHRAATFDPARGSVASWVAAIARNLAIDQLRRRRPTAVDPAVLAALDDPSPVRGPEESAVLRAEVGEVHAALAALPGEQRRAVLLAAWHGRTAQEIAELEGIPLGTAKTRVRTGLGRLRSSLGRSPARREGP